MRFFTILNKGIRAIIDEATTPDSFKKGEKFEQYVRDHLFIPSYYDLLEKTHSYQTNSADYVKSSMNPDYKFRDRLTKREFWLEVKFRNLPFEDQPKVNWCSDQQLRRYQAINKITPSFVIIGFGENPTKPEYLSLIPISHAKYSGLYVSVLEKYDIPISKPVSSKLLWEYF